MVGLGGWIYTILLVMECRIPQSNYGWDSLVVSRKAASQLSFTKEGEGSGGSKQHGSKAEEGICEKIFFVWYDFKFDLVFCRRERGHRHQDGL
jgi:hypothetical protein